MNAICDTLKLTELDVRDMFLDLNPKRGIILKRYKEATGEPFSFYTVTKSKLNSFVKHLKSKMSVNSTKTYSAILKSFINLNDDKINLGKGWEDILDVRAEATSFIVLNEDEIAKLIDFALKGICSDTEKRVTSSFCVSALTGARWSDARLFKDTPMEVGEVFSYVSLKTGVKADIIVSKSLPELCKYVSNVSLVTFNETIRNVCSKLGINSEEKIFRGGVPLLGSKHEFVSSHTARRSFATNLYNRGADLEIIRKMMGHTNYNQTKRYILSDVSKLNDSIATFFDN